MAEGAPGGFARCYFSGSAKLSVVGLSRSRGAERFGPRLCKHPQQMLTAASLPNRRQLSTHGCDMASFYERRGTQIELGDMRGYTDERHDRRAQEAKDDDLEMGPAIRTL